MTPDPNLPTPATLPTTTSQLLDLIDQGSYDPANLPPDERQNCVELLVYQGMSSAEIARLLKVHERTVERDRHQIRRSIGLEPAQCLGDDLLGEMQRLAQGSIQRLLRTCHTPNTPPYIKIWAEEAIVRKGTKKDGKGTAKA